MYSDQFLLLAWFSPCCNERLCLCFLVPGSRNPTIFFPTGLPPKKSPIPLALPGIFPLVMLIFPFSPLAASRHPFFLTHVFLGTKECLRPLSERTGETPLVCAFEMQVLFRLPGPLAAASPPPFSMSSPWVPFSRFFTFEYAGVYWIFFSPFALSLFFPPPSGCT